MPHWAEVAALGLTIGVFSGLFGVGGSSISTPLLRIVFGTPSLIALASPLPVTLPTALAGSAVYRSQRLDQCPGRGLDCGRRCPFDSGRRAAYAVGPGPGPHGHGWSGDARDRVGDDALFRLSEQAGPSRDRRSSLARPTLDHAARHRGSRRLPVGAAR